MAKPRTPKPTGPRIKDEKAYARQIKKEVLDPLFKETFSRLKGVPQIKAAYVNEVNRVFERMTSNPDYGADIARAALDNLRRNHKARMVKSFQSALGVDVGPLLNDIALRPMMNQALMNNVSLIKSISKELNNQVVSVIEDIFNTKGFDQEALIKGIQGRFKVANSRAKLIARDQTNKIIGDLNKARQGEIGITKYRWQTMEDERVRTTHEANNDQVFLWSSPPPETGHPGHDINCRCLAIPIIPELEPEV